MGIFSKIKKAVKSVLKGVGKVFKKAMAFVGKITASKWGKILMLAAAVFTGGMAIAAGLQGFTAAGLANPAASFLTKFVAGSQSFMTALAHPIANAQKVFGTAGQAGAAAGAMTEGLPGAAGAAGGAGGAGGAAAGTANAAQLGGNVAGVVAEEILPGGAAAASGASSALGTAGKIASKVGGGLLDLAKTQGGGLILSQGLQGYAQGKQAEAALKEQQRMSGPLPTGAYNDIITRASDMQTPQGFLDRARQLDRTLTRPRYPEAAGNPEDVYGSYVVAPAGG